MCTRHLREILIWLFYWRKKIIGMECTSTLLFCCTNMKHKLTCRILQFWCKHMKHILTCRKLQFCCKHMKHMLTCLILQFCCKHMKHLLTRRILHGFHTTFIFNVFIILVAATDKAVETSCPYSEAEHQKGEPIAKNWANLDFPIAFQLDRICLSLGCSI